MTYTLVADGTSDAVLLPILTWSLKTNGVLAVNPQFADFERMPRLGDTVARLRTAIDLYPCDLLFVHRDAERELWTARRDEIARAAGAVTVPHVPVIPVRMTEAWLLADAAAIRSAAGNPNGTEPLDLPEPRKLEDVPDPKKRLHEALRAACGRNARRRSHLDVGRLAHLIPNYIDDFSALRPLPAFNRLQEDIRAALRLLPEHQPD